MSVGKTLKLLTLWSGPLPPWYDQFRARMAANLLVDHEVLTLTTEQVNEAATRALGTPCRKDSHYALCDLRPMFGRVFAAEYRDYEWWGWCDLDVAVGDLDKLLVEEWLIDGPYDVVSTDVEGIHGPMTVLRNDATTLDLFRKSDWRTILADPGYCNYDETGFNECWQLGTDAENGNEHFTKVVGFDNGVCLYDARSWTESRAPLPRTQGVPSRGCKLKADGKGILEVPTNRELLLYHFTSKVWPIPDRHERWNRRRTRFLEMTPLHDPPRPVTPGTPPILDPEYWAKRVRDMDPTGPIHVCVYDAPQSDWDRVQKHTAELLRRHVPPNSTILDAGCGYGALLETLGEDGPTVSYTGLDFCPGMLDLARQRQPAYSFHRGDARHAPFADHEFDWAVCRGLEGSVRTEAGNREWNRIESELRRVARNLIVIDLACTSRVVYGEG